MLKVGPCFTPRATSRVSNFIEGTDVRSRRAVRLGYDGVALPRRTNDARDLVGTHRVAADQIEMRERTTPPEEHVQLVRHRHGLILAKGDGLGPGLFEEIPNRAGNTDFVSPDLVVDAPRAGFDRLHELETVWERAVYSMFLVTAVSATNMRRTCHWSASRHFRKNSPCRASMCALAA